MDLQIVGEQDGEDGWPVASKSAYDKGKAEKERVFKCVCASDVREWQVVRA